MADSKFKLTAAELMNATLGPEVEAKDRGGRAPLDHAAEYDTFTLLVKLVRQAQKPPAIDPILAALRVLRHDY